MRTCRRMRRPRFLVQSILLLTAFVMLTTGSLSARAAAKRPNILFIFTDDHAAHSLSCYGSKINKTPNLDRIAKEGTLFRNSFCTNSICGPCRAVILTGKHSHLNGFIRNGNTFNGAQQTFPKLLRQVGYQTAMVGKWHLKSAPTGFDYSQILIGQGPYYNPPMIKNGERVKHVGYTTDIITDIALDFLKNQRDVDKPFCLMYQHKAPHRNWQPGPKYLSMYDDVTIPEPDNLFDDYSGRTSAAHTQQMEVATHLNNADLKLTTPRNLTPEQKKAWDAAYGPKNEAFRKADLKGKALVKWKYQRYIKDYLRCIASVDDNVGRVLDYLDDSGLAKNTIVIYSSDQGFYLGDHGWFDKRFMYEESFRMPLMVRWPGVTKPGTINTDLVSNLDFAETFLDIAGAKIPTDMQGHSLVPLLKGDTPSDWRKSLYYHYYEYPGAHMVRRHFGVRTARHKLIHFYNAEEWELFDLQKDPREMKSVYDDPQYAGLVKELTAEIARYQKLFAVPDDSGSVPKAGGRPKKKNKGKRTKRRNSSASRAQTLEEVKATGALRSSYRKQVPRIKTNEVPQANLKVFRNEIAPVLKRSCVQCHGPETQEGEFRVDTLDPDLLHGEDVNWWLEVVDVLSNGEMPPADEAKLADEDRSKVIDWLSSEIQVASAVRRAEQGHSSFRRMTRYEYNYALQDLLGLPYNFAKDLPPDPTSEDGFQNSSEILQMSAMQFGYYRELSRSALKKATVRGERPDPIYWNIGMEDAMAKMYILHEQELEGLKRRLKDRPEILKQQLERLAGRFLTRPGVAHFKNLSTGQTTQASWRHFGGKYAWKPTETRREAPENPQHVAIIPANGKLVVELGNRVPDTGMLRIRIRASRTSIAEDRVASLRLEFGWQASNNSRASVRVSDRDIAINAPPGKPQFYEWDIPLSEIYPRNPLRATAKMGKTPSPSEYLRLQNSSLSQGDIKIDFIEITAPVYDQWPPKSHTGIFVDSANKANETEYAREVLEQFMSRAWRRSITAAEIDQKVALFARFRPECEDFQEAMIEVLATVLSSPKFLYLIRSDQGSESEGSGERARLTDFELATRLSMFLWCSLPDEELLQLAADERLSDPDVLISQTNRMLTDARSRRFSKNFVRQWLGMQLLDFLDVDKKTFPQFNNDLKEAMQDEPEAFFREVLQKNDSVIDFLHADYTMANERLARHYGLRDVYGNHMRKVTLKPEDRRGGLLTQAGLLAMNSDGKDSHPLKRGIWLLESLLNDPPPPPPPAVPEIDLADPEIAKMTLKQRLEDHRNHAACNSCHAKIDPWGIAFENYDALGRWRDRVNGKPVDATSVLFNNQQLDGMDGLKRFLLKNRQDQFVRAMVYKMTTFALGRPLTFADHSSIDRITADVRQQGDGLATLVRLVATSKLFRSK